MDVYGIGEGKNKVEVLEHKDTGWQPYASGLEDSTMEWRYMDGTVWIRANDYIDALTYKQGDQGIDIYVTSSLDSSYCPDKAVSFSIPLLVTTKNERVGDAYLTISPTGGQARIQSLNYDGSGDISSSPQISTSFCVCFPVDPLEV